MTTKNETGRLHERIMAFQKNGEGYDSIVAELSFRTYSYPKKRRGYDEDDCCGFFLYAFPFIKRLPASFADRGISFERYFSSALDFKLKSYRVKKLKSDSRFEAAQSKEFDETKVCPGSEPELEKSNNGFFRKIVCMNDKCDKKLILLLALKHAQHLDPQHMNKLSRLTGYPQKWILERVEDAKNRIEGKITHLSTNIERRNKLYRNIEILRKRLFSSDNPYWMHHYKIRLDILSERLTRLSRRISKAKSTVSNKDIAEITGFPKGTVDTALRRLKKKLVDYARNHVWESTKPYRNTDGEEDLASTSEDMYA